MGAGLLADRRVNLHAFDDPRLTVAVCAEQSSTASVHAASCVRHAPSTNQLTNQPLLFGEKKLFFPSELAQPVCRQHRTMLRLQERLHHTLGMASYCWKYSISWWTASSRLLHFLYWSRRPLMVSSSAQTHTHTLMRLSTSTCTMHDHDHHNHNNNKRPLTPKSMPPTGDEHAKLKT